MRMEQFFQRVTTVTMKLTRGCNLKCTYCNTETVNPRTRKMSIDLWKRVARLVAENSTSPFISLEFHGGEPMLQPDEWFEEAVAYTRALARQHRKMLDLPIVTNGTLLTPERFEKLRSLGIAFCISCDGPPAVNDLQRGGGHAVQRAIEMLCRERVDMGVLTVMSRTNFDRMTEIMDWYRELGLPGFRINYIQPQGRGTEAHLLSSEEMFEGMRQILDHMARTDVAVYEAEMGQHLDRFVRGREPNPGLSCWEFQCQAGRTYIAVDHLGNMHPCGSDTSNHVFGNVNDEEVDEPRYTAMLNRLHDKGDWVIRCFDCNAKRICNHSCPTSDFNSPIYRENECGYTKLLWRHLCENQEKAYHVHRILTERGMFAPQSFVPLEGLVPA